MSSTVRNALFKSSCNSCIRNKIRCDGNTPCDQCIKKDVTFDCKYAFKKKRGPSSKAPKDSPEKKRARNQEHGIMSAYERRLWTVFFSIFRNQMNALKTVDQQSRESYPWCWFAHQLDTLYEYCSVTCDDNVMQLLDNFYESLQIQRSDLKKGLKRKECHFPSSMCGGCSSEALKPVNHISILRKENNFNESKESIQFDRAFSENKEACFRYKQYFSGKMTNGDNKDELFGTITVNENFANVFGYDEGRVNDLISWTGGQGFLPWGGDIFAALFVEESDLLLFLQIMSFKYQASNLPNNSEKSSTWAIPSSHSFSCWLIDENGRRMKSLLRFKCTHYSYVDENGGLHNRVEMRTKDIASSLAGAVPAAEGQYAMNPPTFKKKKSEDTLSDTSSVDRVDTPTKDYYKKWENFSAKKGYDEKYDLVSLDVLPAADDSGGIASSESASLLVPLESSTAATLQKSTSSGIQIDQPVGTTMQKTTSSGDSLFFGNLLEWVSQV